MSKIFLIVCASYTDDYQMKFVVVCGKDKEKITNLCNELNKFNSEWTEIIKKWNDGYSKWYKNYIKNHPENYGYEYCKKYQFDFPFKKFDDILNKIIVLEKSVGTKYMTSKKAYEKWGEYDFKVMGSLNYKGDQFMPSWKEYVEWKKNYENYQKEHRLYMDNLYNKRDKDFQDEVMKDVPEHLREYFLKLYYDGYELDFYYVEEVQEI